MQSTLDFARGTVDRLRSVISVEDTAAKTLEAHVRVLEQLVAIKTEEIKTLEEELKQYVARASSASRNRV